MTTLHKAAQATLEFLESGDFVYPAQLADDLRAALAQEPAQPNRSAELKSWSLLAVRALDDCHRVIETIVAESTTEEEKLDELDKRVYELFNQALCLHGVMTRSQLDKATGFGRVDVTGPIDGPAQPAGHAWGCKANAFGECSMGCATPQPAVQEPVLYRFRDSESCIRAMPGYVPPKDWTPLYTRPAPQPKRLTNEQIVKIFNDSDDGQEFMELAIAIGRNVEKAVLGEKP
jgi:hypothetical protein